MSRHCDGCGSRVSERARFCEQCGEVLSPVAAPLRAPRELEARFLAQRASIEGERKQVTVMFTDIVGSMELTRALDTERWGELLDRFLAIAASAVHDVEGNVNQFTGDGLMAVFGAPLAHEDHARRACLAVLQLQHDVAAFAREVARTDGVTFAIRCGLNSGEVIVGLIGDDLHMEFAPLGNTTALAKRMESLAPVGSTAISSSTAALVQEEFELRELGEFEVKGAGRSQRVLELVGRSTAGTRLEAVAAARGLTRFVGRDRERATLDAALQRALAGDGLAVGIVGEPGVGKSRLVHEFVADCRERGLVVNTAGGVAHGRYVPFLPVLAMYRDYFGIDERDAPEDARARIEAVMLGLGPQFAEDLPLMFDFLGVPDPQRPVARMDPDVRQRRLLGLVDRMGAARSAQGPAVLVVEDLHWIDDASAAFLEALVASLRGTRTLVVGTYRREYESAWAHTEPNDEIALSPLDGTASRELLDDLLGSHPSVEGLAALIDERTGGNPFFAEESVQALAESGRLAGTRGDHRLTADLAELVLPPTVQAVLAARMDRLPAREKELLQTMSVIGREVARPVLREVCGLGRTALARSLLALQVAELVTERHDEHVFKHPLTQEVAYASQLSQRRARVHSAVAAAIERTYRDKLDERAALVAHHCEAAGELQAAAAWHARAAAWAQITSPADGMRHWRRVRDLARDLPASPETGELAHRARTGILALAWRLGMSPEEIAAIHAEGREQAPDPVGAARDGEAPEGESVPVTPVSHEQLAADARSATGLMLGGREREGLERFPRLVAAAAQLGDDALDDSIAYGYACCNWLCGSLHEAVAVADRALTRGADRSGDGPAPSLVDVQPLVLAARTGCVRLMGGAETPDDDLARALELARAADDPEHECQVLMWQAVVAEAAGEYDAARQAGGRCAEIAERVGNVVAIAGGSASLALAEVAVGRFAEAATTAQQGLERVRDESTGLAFEPMLLAAIARARLGLGDVAGAVAAGEEGVAIMERRGLTACALPAPVALAHVLLTTEGGAAGDRVEALLRGAMDVTRSTGARIFEPRIRRELAALAVLRDDEIADVDLEHCADGRPSPERVLFNLNYAGALLMVGRREREGLEAVKRSWGDALALGDVGLILTISQGLEIGHWIAGSVTDAVNVANRALALAGDDTSAGDGLMIRSPYALALGYRGLCRGVAGDLGEGLADLTRAIELAREQADPESESYLLCSRSVLEWASGALTDALADANRGHELAKDAGNPLGIGTNEAAAATARVATGAFRETLAHAEPALVTVRELGVGSFAEPMLLGSIAQAKLALGDAPGALDAAEEAVDIMETRGLGACAVPAPLALADVLRATGASAGRIEAVLSRGLEVARGCGAVLYERRLEDELLGSAQRSSSP